jgi:HK97 family phage major capsid protein
MNPIRIVAGLVALFAAKSPTIEDLQNKLTQLTASASAIQDNADKEGRALTAEEDGEINGIFASFEATELEIKRRERMEAMNAKLAAPGPRVTEPPALPAAPQAATATPGRQPITGGDRPGASKGTAGFTNLGDFAVSVKNAVIGNGIDPRLRVLNAVPSTQSQEAVGSDGGYLVPPDFRTVIMQKVMGEDALLSLTDQQTTSSNSITVPVDETTPWQTSGGVQVYWEGEGQVINQSKVALNSVVVRANKVSALVPVTDEMLEDAPSLAAYLGRKVPDKMNYKLNDSLINGDGVMKPLGILNSPALVTQAAEGGQVAQTVVYNNITKMWSRMYAPLRRRAVWLINQDIEPQLMGLTVPTTGTSFSGPAYLPPGGLASAPNGTLMGRPIIYSEACSAVGTVGDIQLVCWDQYLSLMKAGGIRQDISMHLWFDYGITAFRFTMRVGGLPWWAGSITRAKSALPLSFAVALAAR